LLATAVCNGESKSRAQIDFMDRNVRYVRIEMVSSQRPVDDLQLLTFARQARHGSLLPGDFLEAFIRADQSVSNKLPATVVSLIEPDVRVCIRLPDKTSGVRSREDSSESWLAS
jgi:hypothetical protein